MRPVTLRWSCDRGRSRSAVVGCCCAGGRAHSGKGFVAGSAGHSQAIERNIPHQFFPMGPGQVVADRAGDTGVPKESRDVVSAWFGPALKFAEHDQAMIEMLDDAGFDAIEAYETEPAHDLGWRK